MLLRFECSPVANEATHVLLAGDLACLQAYAISCMATSPSNVVTTSLLLAVDDAYTLVRRDHAGRVLCVQTREQGVTDPRPGEREIGFTFKKELFLKL